MRFFVNHGGVAMHMKRLIPGVLAALLFLPNPTASWGVVEISPDSAARQQPAGIGEEPHRRAEQRTDIKMVAGEIAAVDIPNGWLTLREITPGESETRTNRYRLHMRDTAVTDPMDKQFLNLYDLQPGYLVRVEYAQVDGERQARTITVDAVNQRRWIVGEITALDPRTGVLTVTQVVPGSVTPVVTHYVLDLQETRVIDLEGQRFLSLSDLQVGDVVQVEFLLDPQGQRLAQLVTVKPLRTETFWASGRIESVDLGAGTLVVSEGIPSWNFTERVYYVIDLNGTRVVDLRGRSFGLLKDLKPGDPVTLQFTVTQGKRSVQYILLEPTLR